MTISHSVEDNKRDFPEVWREDCTEADGLYHYFSAAGILSLPIPISNSSRAVTLLEFNCTGAMLATLSHAFPNVVWIWSIIGWQTKLTSVLILEYDVRQLLWSPVKPDTLLITNECHTPTVHEWVAHRDPRICHVPIKPEGGKHEAAWLGQLASRSIFLFGSNREYIIGRIYEGSEEFETVQSWNDDSSYTSSYTSSSSRLFDTNGG